jgi:hypothetical protein
MSRTTFGSYSRARDGCIVTFKMPDGTLEVRRFTTLVSDSSTRKLWREEKDHRQQAIEWADEHGARIQSISTPETILRDLQGTRAPLEPNGNQTHPPEVVNFPERNILAGRSDLFDAP